MHLSRALSGVSFVPLDCFSGGVPFEGCAGEIISDSGRTDADRVRPAGRIGHEQLHEHDASDARVLRLARAIPPAPSTSVSIYPPGFGNTVPAVGVLIYTASAGNQGTLGGLVEVSRRFAQVLESALERQRLCSGDPVCADHDPAVAAEDRTLHGAACHGCLVIAETSCEARNLFLDRALLVDTVGPSGAAFF